jgi:hypothetical protein
MLILHSTASAFLYGIVGVATIGIFGTVIDGLDETHGWEPDCIESLSPGAQMARG